MGSLRVWWPVALLCGSWLAGQDPVPAAAPEEEVLRVAIEVVAAGEQQPRVPAQDGADPVRAFRLEGRRLRWRLGDRISEDGTSEDGAFEDRDALRKALQSIANDPRRRVPDPTRPGKMRVPPIEVEPADDCRWNDVVQTMDDARAAHFEIVRVADLGEHPTPWLPLSVADPVLDGGAAVMPMAPYSVPDEVRHEFRPVLRVAQSGTVACGDEVLVRPEEPAAVDRLTPWLSELAGRAGQETHVEERSDLPPWSQAPLMIRADLWAPWSAIRRVARAANQVDPRFLRIEFAVGELDYEALLQQGERF